MKKNNISFLLVISILFLSSCGKGEIKNQPKSVEADTNKTEVVKTSSGKEKNEYELYDATVKKFSRITAKELLESNIDKKRFIYFGRRTCPYCRKFVPVLKEVAEKNKLSIEYLDTENTQTDKEIQSIRKKYEVITVPALIYLDSDGTVKKYDSKTKEDLSKWLTDQ